MASQVELLCRLLVENNKFCQSINVINEEILCEYGNESLSGSMKGMELDGLQLIHLLHVAERPSVQEVIQTDIDLLLRILQISHSNNNNLPSNLIQLKQRIQ